jgi:hypothetical protein
MKLPASIEKLGIGVLGVVSLLLVANLVAQYRNMQPQISHVRPAAPGASPARATKVVKATSHAADGLEKYDPDVHLAALSALDSRPLPDEDRNPFEFVGGEPAPVARGPVAVAQAAAPAPAPPPLPLKAVGYNELPGGGKEAMVTFNDDLQVVHEGDVIGTKYKIVKINPTMVVVEDGDTHETHELPFPQ